MTKKMTYQFEVDSMNRMTSTELLQVPRCRVHEEVEVLRDTERENGSNFPPLLACELSNTKES